MGQEKSGVLGNCPHLARVAVLRLGVPTPDLLLPSRSSSPHITSLLPQLRSGSCLPEFLVNEFRKCDGLVPAPALGGCEHARIIISVLD